MISVCGACASSILIARNDQSRCSFYMGKGKNSLEHFQGGLRLRMFFQLVDELARTQWLSRPTLDPMEKPLYPFSLTGLQEIPKILTTIWIFDSRKFVKSLQSCATQSALNGFLLRSRTAAEVNDL